MCHGRAPSLQADCEGERPFCSLPLTEWSLVQEGEAKGRGRGKASFAGPGSRRRYQKIALSLIRPRRPLRGALCIMQFARKQRPTAPTAPLLPQFPQPKARHNVPLPPPDACNWKPARLFASSSSTPHPLYRLRPSLCHWNCRMQIPSLRLQLQVLKRKVFVQYLLIFPKFAVLALMALRCGFLPGVGR
jgi:hypothetical protein